MKCTFVLESVPRPPPIAKVGHLALAGVSLVTGLLIPFSCVTSVVGAAWELCGLCLEAGRGSGWMGVGGHAAGIDIHVKSYALRIMTSWKLDKVTLELFWHLLCSGPLRLVSSMVAHPKSLRSCPVCHAVCCSAVVAHPDRAILRLQPNKLTHNRCL